MKRFATIVFALFLAFPLLAENLPQLLQKAKDQFRLAGYTAPKTYTPGDIQREASLAALNGDARRGEFVYRRPE